MVESSGLMKYAGIFILVIVGFSLVVALYPTAADAGDQMNASNICSAESCHYNASRTTSAVCTTTNTTPDDTTACFGSGDVGVPFASLFAGGGVVFLIIAAGLLMYYFKKSR